MTSVPASTKIGHGLAKGLGINVHYRNDATETVNTAGESIASSGADNYTEREPTVGDYFRQIGPTGATVKHYFIELFPFTKWITRYNTTWATGDLIAGMSIEEKFAAGKIKISIADPPFPRSHRWCSRRAPRNGIRDPRQTPSGVRSLHILRRFHSILGFCNIEGYYHWCE